jgi:hypothetical protein
MARTYDRPPGITVTETAQTNINPLIATPDLLCLVGPAVGSIFYTELVGPLTTTTAVATGTVASPQTVTVVNATNLKVGQLVEGANIASGTKITTISGLTITLSAALTAAITSSNIYCSDVFTLKGVDSTDSMTANSISKVVAPDSSIATSANAYYTSTGGYVAGSYVFDNTNHTIARKAVLPTAKLDPSSPISDVATMTGAGEINLVGDTTGWTASGTVGIGSEQFSYTGLTTSDEKQVVTAPSVVGVSGALVALSSAGQVAGAGFATASGNQTFTSSMVGGSLTVGSATYTIASLSSSTKVFLTESVPADVSATATWTIISPFTLTFDDTGSNPQTTGTINIGLTAAATATNITNALKALSNIGNNDVSTTSTNDYTFTVEFKGSLVGNVSLMTSATSGVTIVMTTPGVAGVFKLTGCTRAVNGTVAATHAINSVVTLGMNIQNISSSPSTAVSVEVTYSYTPSDYYKPYEVKGSNFSDIEDRFGKAFKTDDATVVNSPLALAAKIAIENGANNFLIQPLFYTTNSTSSAMPNRYAPTNAQSVLSTTWEKTFASLRGSENIGIIVPVIGQTSDYIYGSDGDTTTNVALNDTNQLNIIKELQKHIAFVSHENQQSAIGVVGEDSTNTTYGSRSVLTDHISDLQGYMNYTKYWNEQLVFIAQTSFKRASTNGGTIDVALGGQYAAAAIGGMLSTVKVSSSLTRRSIGGFKSIVDTRTKAEKTEDSGRGFFVIEQKRDKTIVVRHALTTDKTNVAKAELSIVRSKFHMIDSLMQTIDTQIIGQMVADDTAPLVIEQVIAGTLRTLQENGEIVGFDSVSAKASSIDPTIIEIRFNYRPAFPINYVDIVFSVDLTSGSTSLTTTDQTNLGV